MRVNNDVSGLIVSILPWQYSHNFYNGVVGDIVNVLLAAAAYNFKRAMKALWCIFKKYERYCDRTISRKNGLFKGRLTSASHVKNHQLDLSFVPRVTQSTSNILCMTRTVLSRLFCTTPSCRTRNFLQKDCTKL